MATPDYFTILCGAALCVCVGVEKVEGKEARLSALNPRKLRARLSFLMSCENGLSSPNLR